MHRIEAYIRLAFIFIFFLSIAYVPILWILKKKGKPIIRQLSYLGLASTCFLILFATVLFVPITFEPEQYLLNLTPFHWIQSADSFEQLLIEKIPNILLFIPLGFFLPMVFPSKRSFGRTTFFCFGITVSIEFFQYFIGRSSDIDDVLTNLLGAIIGYGIWISANHLFSQQKWWNTLVGNRK